ncbi:MAG: VPLPA-CTERM sorting domain-containing protein [Paracoccaceae bacterium]
MSAIFFAAVSAFAAVPANAALVEFSFSGEIAAFATGDAFLASLFPIGTPGSGHLILDYDEDAATAVINSFSATIGFSNFSMPDGAGQSVSIYNDLVLLAPPEDGADLLINDVVGPSFFGYSASVMLMGFRENATSLFSSNTPSVLELTNLSQASDQFVTIFFTNGAGAAVGGVTLRSSDGFDVEVISPVPLPATFGLFIAGLVGLGLTSRRKKTFAGDRTKLS